MINNEYNNEVNMKTIGYLGPRGTFSQEAAKQYILDKEGFDLREFNTIPDLMSIVQKGEIYGAVVPIENSIEGAVNETMDMLSSEEELKIVGEVVVRIKENLLVKKGTKIKDIKTIISHPQPIGQCRKYIQQTFPEADISFVYSTASAAEAVANGNGDMAAIGSIAASEVYDLEIFATDIQDSRSNLTRFVVVSKEYGKRTGIDKTSIVFSTEDKPGSLYRVLDIFNLWDINMTRIESRPAKNKLGKYVFFVDIIGHWEDEDIKDALTMIERKSSYLKVLGSYPQFQFK